MKTLIVFGFLILGIFSKASVSAQEKLVAPLPPQAVEYDVFQLPSRTTSGDPGFSRAYHSPLPVDRVVGFYNQEGGSMEEVETGIYRSHLVDVKFLELGFLHVYAVPRKPGVTVRCIKTVSRDRICSSDFFNHFRRMADALDKYSEEDYRNLCKQYGYLDYAWFGLSDKTDAHGNKLTRDKVLYHEYLTRFDYAEGDMMTAEGMMEMVQKLMAEGKIQEASELAEQLIEFQIKGSQSMMEQSAAIMQGQPLDNTVEDHWDEWLQFLKELEAMVYPTLVIIDRHPSDWKDDDGWIQRSIEW